MTSAEIRQQFISFFVEKHGHTFVPSSPVVPLDDPTLLFTNAGMNQFKPIFLGLEQRAYRRAVNTQKCIRAGGKHNDLDDVGRSRRHHTFFEMLGNWSFGDYFKRGAIAMSWELLTKVWKLDPQRLHVSCYEGDEKAGIPRDTEAADLWKEIAGLPEDHIHYFGKDNFWEMGDTGPCGPCTEIYYDRTPDKSGGKSVNGDDPRVMEIWNNVFIQYNRDANGKLTTLPNQHVDTGMGFERICQVLQDVDSNYSIDLWHPFWAKLKELSGHSYAGKFPKTNSVDAAAEAADEVLRKDIAFRVIGDHVRCLTFALNDGAVPSNEGRGYVLRRILRRAVRFGRQQLGLREPFLHTLVPVVVESMGDSFPELKNNPQAVSDLIKDEEVSFGRTLDRGIILFEEAVAAAIGETYADNHGLEFRGTGRRPGSGDSSAHPDDRSEYKLSFAEKGVTEPFDVPLKQAREGFTAAEIRPIGADAAFKLHDTYGFPIDLTRIMAEERGMSVDVGGYEKLMEQAKELARSGGKDEGGKKLTELPPAALAQLQQAGVKPTDDSAKFAHGPVPAKIMAIWNGDDLGLSPADAFEDERLAVILDRTGFYAEMGGQIGDGGEIRTAAGAIFDVETTKSVGGFILHLGRVRSGKIAAHDAVTATVAKNRGAIEQNHTATHIANWALREVGDAVQQKGSLVDSEKLRFDFSHGKSLSDEEVSRVETLTNEKIAAGLPVYIELAPQEQALKIHGLRAVFGEKYPPMVRVVSIGVPVGQLLAEPANEKWREYSVEFCGGAHLGKSSDALALAITAEESVSKGVRRIVALTGNAARAAVQAGEKLLARIAEARNGSPEELSANIALIQQALAGAELPLRSRRAVQAGITELQQKVKAWEKSNASQGGSVDIGAVAAKLAETGPIVVSAVDGANDDQLRSVIVSLKKRLGSHAILLGSSDGAKLSFIAAVSDDLIARGLMAVDWVREAAKVAGGGGGGRPQMAQAGGKDPAKLAEALEAAKSFSAKTLGK